MRTVKVLINAFSARQGGGQTYLANLLERLSVAQPLEVLVLAPQSFRIPDDRPNLKRVKVRWPTENPLLRAIWEKAFLPWLIRRSNIDVVFCPGGVIGIGDPPGCKTVTMFRNMIPFDLKQRRRYPLGYQRIRCWILQKLMLRSMIRADLVIFISEYAKAVIEKLTPSPLKKTIVIPHGVNPKFKSGRGASSAPPAWLPDTPYVMYVSTLDVYKAQVEIVQGFARFKQLQPGNEKLILVGPENPTYGRKVRKEIHRLGQGENVLIIGSVSYHELPGAYRRALINVFASESENCPNVLLEALAAGRPVLSSDRPPMPEFGGNAVVYFDPASPADFANKLKMMLTDSSLLRDLALRAEQRSQLYNWDIAAANTWKAIYEVAQADPHATT